MAIESGYKTVSKNISKLWAKTEAFTWLEALNRNTTGWIAKYYPNHVQEKIDVYLDLNLSNLYDNRNVIPDDLLDSFHDKTAEYFDSVIEDTVYKADSMGMIQACEDFKITEVRFKAVIDERTSVTCRFLNHKRYKVRNIRDKINRFVVINELEQASDYWRTPPGITGSELIAQGVDVPPLHPRCRSRLLPVR